MRILYTLPPELDRKPTKPLQQGHEVFQERQAPERVQDRRRERQNQEPPKDKRQERQSPEPERKKPVLRPQEAPVTHRQENKQKNGSRSERDSPVIKTSSSTHKENGASRTMRERPSVAARLKVYQVQLKKPSAPAKEKAKAATKNRLKTR